MQQDDPSALCKTLPRSIANLQVHSPLRMGSGRPDCKPENTFILARDRLNNNSVILDGLPKRLFARFHFFFSVCCQGDVCFDSRWEGMCICLFQRGGNVDVCGQVLCDFVGGIYVFSRCFLVFVFILFYLFISFSFVIIPISLS